MNEITPIRIPALNDSNYGIGINEAIENINKNFQILANRDFVKGDKGNSIITKTIDLTVNKTLTEQLKYAVSNQYANNPIKPKQINGIDIFKWFDNPGTITLIYEVIDNQEVIVSSMPYVFKDLRFKDLYKSTSDYDKETDYSCVLYYYQGEFIAVQEFPTIYYDSVNGHFSWKLNGVETGLEAMGPQGKPGRDGVFKIVKVKNTAEYGVNIYKIDSIIFGEKTINVNNGTELAADINGDVVYDENGNSLELNTQVDICNYYGVTEGISVMVIKEPGNSTYISEVWQEEDTSNPQNMKNVLVVRCSDDNKVCEIESMTKNDVVSLCEEYLK